VSRPLVAKHGKPRQREQLDNSTHEDRSGQARDRQNQHERTKAFQMQRVQEHPRRRRKERMKQENNV
jgi:hypothetical protein